MSTDDPFAAIGAALTLPDAEAAADWEAMDLREQARLDPPPGVPMQVGAIECEPGEWKAMGLADRETGLPVNCPVVPLGRTQGPNGGVSHFLNAMGQIAELKDSSSGKGPIRGVFAGRSQYLEWMAPRFSKPSKASPKGRVIGWEADDVAQMLVDACAWAGPYDPDLMHGRGAWRGHDGALTYHAGDRVYVEGEWRKPGRHGGWIYPSRPPMAAPWTKHVPDGRHGPFEQLTDTLMTWNWRRKDIDPHLLAGWVCMAMIAGALDWRAMVFITAERGSGKSTLLNLLRELFGRGLLKTGNTTGAYLYQKLGHDCIPVVIDELEAKPASDPASPQKVIELIRMASSGDKIGRGSSDGIAKEFECRSAFVCASINVPAMQGQDQSRFAILNLDTFAKADADPKIPWTTIGDVGRQLMRRMLDGFPRYQRTLIAFKEALIKPGGHNARGAEQFGALLAAAHIAEHDADPTAEQLATWAQRLKASELNETANAIEDWRAALFHVTDVTPAALRNKNSRMPTLGARLASFRHRPGAFEDVKEICTMMGLALSLPKGEVPTWENTRLFVPCSHPGTRETFAGTNWEGSPGTIGVWHQTLLRAPPDMIWRAECGAGLDKKRAGVMIQLCKAFPDVGEDEGGGGGEGPPLDFQNVPLPDEAA